MNWREFRRKGRGKKAPLLWKIAQQGESYTTESGMLGGAMQTFSDTPGSKGKTGTKAFVTPKDNCTFHVSREIRKKTEKGYIEYVDGEPLTEAITEIDPKKELPKNFCSYKPQTSITESALRKLHAEGRARYTRKQDGMCHLAYHHPWGWEIYTRGMDITSERFPIHIKQLEKTKFDVGTLIQGEFICSREDGTDDFKAISRICRSDPAEARQLIKDKEVPEPVFLIFDIIFHNRQDMSDCSYGDRSKLWSKFGEYTGMKIDHRLLYSVEYCNVTPDTWEGIAKRNKWEGFVVTDIKSVPGDKFYSFDGDPKRPRGHHKLKPVYEDDVVIFATINGTGKRLNKAGALCTKQRYPKYYPGTEDKHPLAGQWFYCGKVGSGLTDEDVEEFTASTLPFLMSEKELEDSMINCSDGIVAMIEFAERQIVSQKFRHGVFIRTRTDKGAKECYAQRLAAEEE